MAGNGLRLHRKTPLGRPSAGSQTSARPSSSSLPVRRGRSSSWCARSAWPNDGADTIARSRREFFAHGRVITDIVRDLHVSRDTVRMVTAPAFAPRVVALRPGLPVRLKS